jgi:hypothetical protein
LLVVKIKPSFTTEGFYKLKNSVPKVGKGIGKGERGWSTEEKDQLISILDNDGFDGISQIWRPNFRAKVLTVFNTS